MTGLAEIRPKFKQDSIFLRTKDGVFFQRSDKFTFRLKGASVYQWLTLLLPHMTGEHTLAEISEQLSVSEQTHVYKLVETLLQRDILKDEPYEDVELLSDAVKTFFRPQIEFIDHYVNHPQKRFQTFRESRIALLGKGEAYLTLANVLLDNGLAELFLAPDEHLQGYIEQLQPKVDALLKQGIITHITPASSWRQDENLQQFDIIVYCSDTPSLSKIYELNQFALNKGKRFLPAYAYAGQVQIGPLVEAGGPCWVCAQLRLTNNSSPERFAVQWRDTLLGTDVLHQQAPLYAAIARRMGNGLGFELFKLFTGVLPTEARQGIILQDSEILETHYGKVSRYPYCPLCDGHGTEQGIQSLQEIVAGKRDQALDIQTVIERVAPLINEYTGVFQRFDDGALMQLPIKVSKLVVNLPISPAQKKLDVTTYSIENVLEARYRAIQEAIKVYTKALPQKPISATYEALVEDGKQAVPEQQLTTWSGVTRPGRITHSSWLPAVSLLYGHNAYVPAASVHPATALNREGIFENTTAGSGIGLTYEQAAYNGLVSALAYEELRGLSGGQNGVIDLLPILAEVTDTDTAFLVQSIKRFDIPFVVWEVATDKPVHIIIAYATDERAEENFALGIGLSGKEAVETALLGLVGNLQLQRAGEALSTTTKDLYPWFSPRVPLPLKEGELSRYQEAAVTGEQIKDYLKELHRDAFFVNTTTVDIWDTKSFISSTVLLTRPE